MISRVRDITLASLFASLTAIGSFVGEISVGPVPMTLQTFFTYLAGGILGSYGGALSQIIYILLGSVGLPVFAQRKSGPAVLVGYTGGYLIGFVVGAFIIGKLVESQKNIRLTWIMASMVVGTLAIYFFGVIQLSLWYGLPGAILFGVLPFIIGDILKILTASYITIKVRKTLPNSVEDKQH